jgi:thiosulfate reductase cytochrome b subunit
MQSPKIKHPLMVRLTHWVNGPVLLLMIWSGLLIYWAQDDYAIRIGNWEVIKFFPTWFYNGLGLESQLALGMAVHFTLAWLFGVNGIIYVLYTFVSGYWRHLMPNRRTPIEAFQVMLHDLRLRKTLPPQGIFNAAQKMAYCGVISMGFGSLVTGFAIYKPVQLGWMTELLGGYQTARLIHFALTLGYCGFSVIHITQVIRAGWRNFRAMVVGYE